MVVPTGTAQWAGTARPGRRRGVIAIARRGGRFLAIRRGPDVAAGGTICFPGGHIEPGEEEAEAVVRECREEVAAEVAAVACVWRSVSPWGTELAWWTATLVDASRLTPHPVEVSEILWLSAEEMIEHPELLSGNRPFLEAVIAGRLQL
jgi:8-oxo-dGTP pyrophosphatase MutT (NUDIX family)